MDTIERLVQIKVEFAEGRLERFHGHGDRDESAADLLADAGAALLEAARLMREDLAADAMLEERDRPSAVVGVMVFDSPSAIRERAEAEEREGHTSIAAALYEEADSLAAAWAETVAIEENAEDGVL